jgi:hypothetical protein
MSEASFITWYKDTFSYTVPCPVSRGAGTPYYKFWEIGVAAPIPNYHFSVPKKLRLYLDSGIAAGNTTFGIDCATSSAANITKNYIGNGGFALLVRADNSLTEIVEIASVTVSTTFVILTLQYALKSTFYALDSLTFVSDRCVDLWDTSDSALIPISLVKTIPYDLINMVK